MYDSWYMCPFVSSILTIHANVRFCTGSLYAISCVCLFSVCSDVMMDFDDLVRAQTGLGTAAIIVMNKQVCLSSFLS